MGEMDQGATVGQGLREQRGILLVSEMVVGQDKRQERPFSTGHSIDPGWTFAGFRVDRLTDNQGPVGCIGQCMGQGPLTKILRDLAPSSPLPCLPLMASLVNQRPPWTSAVLLTFIQTFSSLIQLPVKNTSLWSPHRHFLFTSSLTEI